MLQLSRCGNCHTAVTVCRSYWSWEANVDSISKSERSTTVGALAVVHFGRLLQFTPLITCLQWRKGDAAFTCMKKSKRMAVPAYKQKYSTAGREVELPSMKAKKFVIDVSARDVASTFCEA